MNTTGRLLYIVVRDTEARKELSDALQSHGFGVMAMSSAAELSQRLKRLQPHLILLDVDLPGVDGPRLCQTLRGRNVSVPMILLSARCEIVDRVIGLEMGADDFVGKPYALREVCARVKAVLRRSTVKAAGAGPGEGTVVIGVSTFSPATRRIGQHGQDVILSELDGSVLAELVAHPEAVISRQHLLSVSRPHGADLGPTAVDRTVFRLRKLIETDASAPRYIRSVRGHGYVYSPTGAGGAHWHERL